MFVENLGKRYRWGLVLAAYLILTIGLTYPLTFHLSDHVTGIGTADIWQFPWNNFIFKERILSGKDPYFTDRIYYPEGASLLLHTNTEINSVLGMLLSPFVNEIGQMNLGLLLSTFLSAVGTFLLTLHLTRSFTGSLFAGIAFAFCPFLITRYFGDINFALAQMVPFSLWAFFRLAETQKYRFAILMGLFFGLTYYSNQYYLVFLTLSFALMLVYGLCTIPAWRTTVFLKMLALSGLVAALLLAQIGLHFLQNRKEKLIAPLPVRSELSERGSAELSDYLLPGPMSGLSKRILGEQYGGAHSKITTGVVTLLLAIAGMVIAIRRRNHSLILVGLLGIFFLVLSLGPHLEIRHFRIPLPYALLKQSSYLNHVRIPYRAAPMVALSFSIMAGFGISLLSSSAKRWHHAIVGLLFCALVFEISQAPLALSKFYVPEVYSRVSKMPPGTMLTIPFFNNIANAAHHMKYQIIHKKELLNGRLARPMSLVAQQSYLQTIPITRSLDEYTTIHDARALFRHVDIDQESARFFREFFNVRYLSIEGRYTSVDDVKSYVSTVFPDARLLGDEFGARVYQLPEVFDPVVRPDRHTIRFFLFSGWDTDINKFGLGTSSEAKLLLPHVENNQKCLLNMRIRSGDIIASEPEKVLFMLNETAVAEAPLEKSFVPVHLFLSGKQITDHHNLMKIQLVDSNRKPLHFGATPGVTFELQIFSFKKQSAS